MSSKTWPAIASYQVEFSVVVLLMFVVILEINILLFSFYALYSLQIPAFPDSLGNSFWRFQFAGTVFCSTVFIFKFYCPDVHPYFSYIRVSVLYRTSVSPLCPVPWNS